MGFAGFCIGPGTGWLIFCYSRICLAQQKESPRLQVAAAFSDLAVQALA
jgi:hypothetical protein